MGAVCCRFENAQVPESKETKSTPATTSKDKEKDKRCAFVAGMPERVMGRTLKEGKDKIQMQRSLWGASCVKWTETIH